MCRCRHLIGLNGETAPGLRARFALVEGLLSRNTPFVDLWQVRDVHICAHKTRDRVTVQRTPVRLDRHTFVDHDGLNFGHHFTTLASICDRVGFGQKRVELRVGPSEFVPCNAGPVGQTQNLCAQRAVVPVGRRERVFGPVVPECGTGQNGPLDLEARVRS